MKILRISLHNIASLAGTHTVDFTREPLRTAGLFSISGPTGSGKSTLLDALCLALFERTPRLHGVRGAVKFLDRGGEITQQDPGNLLRRGTGRGFAEVAFIGVDGATYTARWMVRRSRNQPDGPIQATEMALFRGNVLPDRQGIVEVGGRKTEVLEAIESRLGLNFKQFTRAVLLAQNDFTTFLKADDKERAEILQALTGTERFESISKMVFARCADAQKAVAETESRLSGNAPLSVEARGEAEISFANADAALRVSAEKVKARQAHADWFTKCAEFSDTVARAEAALRDAIALRDAEGPRKLELEQAGEISRDARPLRDAERRAMDESVAAARAREATAKADMDSQTELEQKRAAYDAAAKAWAGIDAEFELAKPKLVHARMLDIKLPEAAARFASAVKERETAAALKRRAEEKCAAFRKERQSALDETEALSLKRAALADIAPFAKDARAWLERLDRATDTRTAFVAAEQELKRHEKAARAKGAAVAELREKGVALNGAVALAVAELEKAEVALRDHDGDNSADNRRRAGDAMAAIQTCRGHLHELAAAVSREAELRRELSTLTTAQESDGRRLTDLRATGIPASEIAYESARCSFELAEAAVADATIALREKLVAGHECPVCGGTEHPYSERAPGTEAVVLRELRTLRDTARKSRDALRNEAAALDAVCRNRAAEIAGKSSALEDLLSHLERVRTFRLEHPAWTEIMARPEAERMRKIEERLAAEAAIMKAADDADAARRKAEKRRDDARLGRDKAASAVNVLDKGIAEAEAALAGANATRDAALGVLKSAESASEAALFGIRQLFDSLADSRSDWERDAAKFREVFAARTSEWIVVEKRAMELADITGKLNAALGPEEETLIRMNADLRLKEEAEASARATNDSLTAERRLFFDGRPVDEVEGDFLTRVKMAMERRDALAGEAASSDKRRAACAEALRSAVNMMEERRTALEAVGRVVDDWLAAFARRTGRIIDRVELDSLLLRDEAWFRAERSALDALEHSVRTFEGALKVHRKSFDEHANVRPSMGDEAAVRAELPGLLEEFRAAEFARDELRAALLADDQRRTATALIACELETRRVAARPWERLNELIGSADGAKFRGIAQRRTLDVLLGYSNRQLGQLAPRYRLERIPESLNLIVLDRDMGDERRSVHSLSGGESFLVSLALALGLAALTSNRLRIESLFIDEGFGNLDVETLNIAMGALMRLESQGRKVGVISHVSEMADAIPVQIRVAKGRGGASRLIVPSAGGQESYEEKPAEGLPISGSDFAATMLAILRREREAGSDRVSVRTLREELGCDAQTFRTARKSLGTKVRLDGRSIVLVEE